MARYRHKIKEIKEEKDNAVLAIIDLGMLGESDPVWVPKDMINENNQIDSSWLEQRGF